MTIKKKIFIGYGVSFTLMGLVVAWAVINLVSLGNATEAILSENYRSILAAENMVNALERQDSGVLIYFLGDLKDGIVQYRKNEANFLEWLGRAKDNVTIQGEKALVQSIDADYARYRKQFSALTDLGPPRAAALPPSQYRKAFYPYFIKVRKACIDLRNLNQQAMYSASFKAGQMARRAIWSTVAVAGAALIVALGFSLFLAERISGPIRRFMEASRRISEGDYTIQVPLETGDELGRLAYEFNRMAAQLGRYNKINVEQIITEKNKADAILSSIEDPLVVFDTALKVTGINAAARRIMNLGFSEETASLCTDILPNLDLCDLIKQTVETGEQPNVPDEQRIILLQQEERSRHYLFSVTPIRGRGLGLVGVVLLLRDVTRLKEVERLKSEFVAMASHELRTPLTSLGMSIDLLLEHQARKLPENDHVLLQAAHEEVNRMKALVNDLLDLSKIEAGRIELVLEFVPVTTLFEHVETVFKSQMDIKQVTLTFRTDEDLPKVRADANKIAWVLTNLISNALRYVKKGGHIELFAQRIGPYVHLSVRDDGPGIAPEYQSRIFQKFVQVKGSETGGSGLGLAICKEIVRAHGGAIWVESFPGCGSTFTFTLSVEK